MAGLQSCVRSWYGKNNLVVLALRHSPAALDDEVLKLPSAGSKLAASHRIHRRGDTFAVVVVEASLDRKDCQAWTGRIVEGNGK